MKLFNSLCLFCVTVFALSNAITCYASSDPTHWHSARACGEDQIRYEEIISNEKGYDSVNHKVTVFYSELCSCGEIVKLVTKNSINEPHTFDSNEQCTKCKYRKRIDFPEELSFLAVKDSVSKRDAPSDQASVVEKLATNQIIEVKGRYRSDNGNMWAITSDDHYIYMPNIALNLDEKLKTSCSEMDFEKKLASVYVIDGNPDYQFLGAFTERVQPNGKWDFKNFLGSSEKYSTYINGTFNTYTGEQLGNIHYGYVGFHSLGNDSEDLLLYSGGIVNIIENGPFEIKECFENYCDNPDDVIYVKKGINYCKNGTWE